MVHHDFPSGTGWPGEVVLHGGGHSHVGQIFVPGASVLGRSGHGPSNIFRPPPIHASSQVPQRFFHDLSPYFLLYNARALCANVCRAFYCDGGCDGGSRHDPVVQSPPPSLHPVPSRQRGTNNLLE
mmetsp:Transcript_20708/g.23751  ORF Transcript_20708/g.23751 Transcript_20708/m.23751 type:complete len:126 (+) Transcript_20708:248-625(+)